MKSLIGFLVSLRFKQKSNVEEVCEKICKMNDFKGAKKNRRLILEIVKLNSVKKKIPLEDMKLVIAEMINEVLFSQV